MPKTLDQIRKEYEGLDFQECAKVFNDPENPWGKQYKQKALKLHPDKAADIVRKENPNLSDEELEKEIEKKKARLNPEFQKLRQMNDLYEALEENGLRSQFKSEPSDAPKQKPSQPNNFGTPAQRSSGQTAENAQKYSPRSRPKETPKQPPVTPLDKHKAADINNFLFFIFSPGSSIIDGIQNGTIDLSQQFKRKNSQSPIGMLELIVKYKPQALEAALNKLEEFPKETVSKLLEQTNDKGETVLMQAMKSPNCNEKHIGQLLNLGAKVGIKNTVVKDNRAHQVTPLGYADSAKKAEVLLDHLKDKPDVLKIVKKTSYFSQEVIEFVKEQKQNPSPEQQNAANKNQQPAQEEKSLPAGFGFYGFVFPALAKGFQAKPEVFAYKIEKPSLDENQLPKPLKADEYSQALKMELKNLVIGAVNLLNQDEKNCHLYGKNGIKQVPNTQVVPLNFAALFLNVVKNQGAAFGH